ncbi:hypothetical protein NC651_040025 [Populus alba x Populus x berolinensis]|nr:hypothetical protein NC651_040025 [Populus alba x Populus x berolinensis]
MAAGQENVKHLEDCSVANLCSLLLRLQSQVISLAFNKSFTRYPDAPIAFMPIRVMQEVLFKHIISTTNVFERDEGQQQGQPPLPPTGEKTINTATTANSHFSDLQPSRRQHAMRRLIPRTTSGGGAWRRCAANVLGGLEAFQQFPGFLEAIITFVGKVFTDYITDGILPSEYLLSVIPHSVAISVVSVIFHTDRINPSVNSSVFLYRRIISVGEYVGDGMAYLRHCLMPTDLFRR